MTDNNRQVAIKFLSSVASGHADLSGVTLDAVWWVLGRRDMPLREFVGGLSKSFRLPGRIEVVAVTAEGDRVALEAESFFDTTSGKSYHNRYHFVIEFRDGFIFRVKEYCDTAYVNAIFEGDFFGG